MELIAESKIQIISNGKLFPDFIETSKSYNLMATDAMIIEIMKRKTEEYSQPPQISPASCRIEEERRTKILTGCSMGQDRIRIHGNMMAPRI